MDTSSCSSPSSSDNEGQPSDIENEKPQHLSHIVSSANKRARADATSTESLSPPRTSVTNSN
ncbi:unnamed protein product, partial [Rotaria magnacalcarata]